jgi:arylacetamide deacetylase-like 2
MARTAQRLAIIGAITASIIGYLYYAPGIEDMAQTNRIRALGATMKITQFVGTVAELTGLSTRLSVIRKVGSIIRYLKDKQEDAGLEIEDTLIEDIPVRIARPLNNNDYLPAIIYFHGGAFYMASVDTHNSITSTIARLANVVVISVDYRLAPEYPFPAGLDDCYAVAKYVLEHGDSRKLRIDRSRVALAGDSAGGNFAAVNAMRFATHPVGQHSPRLQILIYPVVQLFDMMLPSYIQEYYQILDYTVDNVLSLYLNEDIDKSIYANNHTSVKQKKHYRKYVDWSLIPSKYRTIYKHPITDDNEGDPNLIESAKEALNPEVSPLLVEDEQLAKLPPTYILSVGEDRLRDEAFIYGGRLKRAGVSVVHNHYERTFHASLNFLYGPFGLEIANKMLGDIIKYIKTNL